MREKEKETIKEGEGITLNNENVVSLIKEGNKKLSKMKNRDLGECERCGKPAFAWYRNERLCQNCIVEIYDKNQQKMSKPEQKKPYDQKTKENN